MSRFRSWQESKGRLPLSKSSTALLTPEFALQPTSTWSPTKLGRLEAAELPAHHLHEALRRNAIVLVKASWCPHCQSYVPKFKAMAPQLAYSTVIVEAGERDNPAHRAFNSKYGIQGFPTLLLLREDGTWKTIGAQEQAQVEAEARQFFEMQ